MVWDPQNKILTSATCFFPLEVCKYEIKLIIIRIFGAFLVNVVKNCRRKSKRVMIRRISGGGGGKAEEEDHKSVFPALD